MIHVSDIPKGETIFAYLRRQTGYDQAIQKVKPRIKMSDRLELQLVETDAEALKQSVLNIIATYGYSGWRHANGESKSYGGFSLTYNPEHQDGLDPHVSTLGTPKNRGGEFFWSSMQNHEALKHSYFDTYGFRARTPASKEGYLGEFIDSFRRVMIRSRVGIIPGENIDPTNKVYQDKEGWHRDEPVFENIRINVPLQTDASYVFQMEGQDPYHLHVGKAYTWDTHIAHRVFAVAPTKTMRIHLVLGFSPWFDYVPEHDAWKPNEFFGRMHPFDMVAEGYLSRHLRVAPKKLN